MPARKLNTTQSAISKRVQELESSLGAPLFDRAQRNAKLSEKGAPRSSSNPGCAHWPSRRRGPSTATTCSHSSDSRWQASASAACRAPA
ncbi:helix-turn-helix domain-containing protein [Variovorax sp. LjRoot84]|uniref:helix-turn-helix domain-containing protein n=1 Tax=Variovorax sp. LjRoot84 TaxID=3342340 RepID=UPI003F50E05B